mgnify:CR=1 FL=1
MFDIPEKDGNIIISYLNNKFNRKDKSPSEGIADKNILENLHKKANQKTLLLSKTLMVKF